MQPQPQPSNVELTPEILATIRNAPNVKRIPRETKRVLVKVTRPVISEAITEARARHASLSSEDLGELVMSPNERDRRKALIALAEDKLSALNVAGQIISQSLRRLAEYEPLYTRYETLSAKLETLLENETKSGSDADRLDCIKVALSYVSHWYCGNCGGVFKEPLHSPTAAKFCPVCPHTISNDTRQPSTGFILRAPGLPFPAGGRMSPIYAVTVQMSMAEHRNRTSSAVQDRIRPYATRSLLESLDPTFNWQKGEGDYLDIRDNMDRELNRIAETFRSVQDIVNEMTSEH